MENKHHYRNVFKSDHLGSADLEDFIEKGTKLIFTIKEVRQEKGTKVAGKKIDANIAYFVENIKPLVLNATNSKIVKSFTISKEHPNGSPFVEDWKNLTIELYIDENVQMKGEKTQGVRIRPIQPVAKHQTANRLFFEPTLPNNTPRPRPYRSSPAHKWRLNCYF